MDWTLSADLAERLAALRRLIARHVVPLEGEMFRHGFPAVEARLVALRDRVRDLGLFAPHLPAAWGGAGLPLPQLALVGEALGWSPLGHFICNCQAPDAGNAELLLRHGSAAQQDRWLAPLARGEMRSCFGMTEPDRAGSNPVWLATTARRDGDDYVVDGRKWFTSGADGAALCIVMAVTDAQAAAHGRASMLLVPTDAPGFELVRNLPVMGESGGGWASHGEIALSGVRVPVADRIGAEGAGFALAQERLGPGRIHHCMRWIGICERAFDLMCRRAARRELAPGDPLASRQLVQAWVAECRAEIDAARLLVLRTAWRLEAEAADHRSSHAPGFGHPSGPGHAPHPGHTFEPAGRPDRGDSAAGRASAAWGVQGAGPHGPPLAARDDVSLIKFHVAAVLQRTLDRAIQVHGAAGLLDESPLAFWWRHERGARIYDGPDEVHKTAVARRILAAYAADAADADAAHADAAHADAAHADAAHAAHAAHAADTADRGGKRD